MNYPKEIYVLWWKYSDGSAVGLVRAYESEARAQADLELLKEHDHSKEWMLATLVLKIGIGS